MTDRSQRQRRLGSGRLLVLPLVALMFCAGCYRFVPIEPNYAHGKLRKLSHVRVGGEGGEVVDNVQITWPKLFVTQGEQLQTLDLREVPAERRDLTRGGVAAIVVPNVLAGFAMTAALGIAVIVGLSSFSVAYY